MKNMRANRAITKEELMEEKFNCVINALIENWKPGSQCFRMETSKGVELGNEGKQSLYFGPFSKEEADFIEAKYVSELTEKENVKEENVKEENVKEENVKEENVKEDLVNHPKHYTSDPSGVECIQITRHRNFNVGNAIKYLWRNGLKDGNSDIQDLEKAIWYLKDEIKRLKGEYDK